MKSLDRTSGELPFVTAGETNEGISAYIGNKVKVFSENTTTIDMFGSAKYRNYKYGADDHVAVVHTEKLPKSAAIFLTSAIHKSSHAGQFDYSRNFYATDADELIIQLPIKNSKIDFEFMESFITELEAHRITELEAYLLTTELKNYNLTKDEQQSLDDFENLDWQTFNLEELFGKSTRGQRLKSADRILGALPFVTAGETDEGISAFIGNNVNVFMKNTTTIDMFGSAKYRNYKYGGDDHVAIIHTESLPKFAAIFVTSAIHKSSHAGQFDYSRNFYAKNADELNIKLPVKNNQPDYELMETFISAIQKLVIKDVVLYANRKIAATKHVVRKN